MSEDIRAEVRQAVSDGIIRAPISYKRKVIDVTTLSDKYCKKTLGKHLITVHDHNNVGVFVEQLSKEWWQVRDTLYRSLRKALASVNT